MNLTAYIDPGSTALVWQILAGVFIVFGVVVGIWWTKITTFFKSVWTKLFNKNEDDDDISDDEQEALDELSDDEEFSDEEFAESDEETEEIGDDEN